MIIGENYKEKFGLNGRYEGEWIELRVPDVSVIRVDSKASDAGIHQIKAILCGWSVTDKNGAALPITVANIERMPIDWFNQVGTLVKDFLSASEPKQQ